jgi:2-methylcitrate dehydratase PrpD
VRLVDRLGSRWALLETSFKLHASCRHTHPAAPKGDPGDTLSRSELADKFRRLTAFSGAATAAEAETLIERAWRLCDATDLNPLI